MKWNLMKLSEEFAFLSYPCSCALSSRGWGATIPGAPGVLPWQSCEQAGSGGCSSPGLLFEAHTGLEIPELKEKCPGLSPDVGRLLL